MLKKVNNLQKDLEIHREIEEELAKRSHYSRGIIKKLTAKIAELEESLKESAEKQTQRDNKDEVEGNEEDLKKQEVIRSLDRSLEHTEKKFLKLQSESNAHRSELEALRNKLELNEKKTNGLLEILLRGYSDLEEGKLEGQ